MTTPEGGCPGRFTLRRSREGYFWTIEVVPTGDGVDAMRDAVEVAQAIDRELAAAYPRRRRKTKPDEADAPEGAASS